MPVSKKSLANLRPPIKPGERLNKTTTPRKPKGARSIKVLIREIAEKAALPSNSALLDDLKEKFPNQFKSGRKQNLLKIGVLKLLAGMQSNNEETALRYIREVFDRLEGKPTTTVAGDTDNPINIIFEAVGDSSKIRETE